MQIRSDEISLILAKKRMKRVDLAALSGISKSNLATILKRGSCTERNVGRIAFGLGVPVEAIIADEKGGEAIGTRSADARRMRPDGAENR